MNEFKRYHPVVNFTYFLFAIVFTCLFMHPITLVCSLIAGFCHSVLLKGKNAIKKTLLYMLPTLLIMALINPLFNHEGLTILTYLPDKNPLTLESIFYGLSSAAMIVSVILHFSCFNQVMTSDKFIYLFAKSVPTLSLIFSMVLSFVPRFTEQIKLTSQSQKCIGRDVSSGGIVKRAKSGLAVLSTVITKSLENAIDASNSMKARGYGLHRRTAFSIYKFSSRDITALVAILLTAIYVMVGSALGELEFVCFPTVQIAELSLYGLSVFISYILLLFLPLLIELWEVIKWKSVKSKL